MNAASKPDLVRFSVRGQVVIPRRLRKEFEIEEGTRAQVYAENGAIVIKPITAKQIRSLRGILKRKPGERPFGKRWAEYKAEEKALEDAKDARLTRSR